jgi:hypothetical protein
MLNRRKPAHNAHRCTTVLPVGDGRGDAPAGPAAAEGPLSGGDEKKFELPEPLLRPWPKPPDEHAFSGLTGDVVRRIEPHTEADPAAILLQFLVAFGSCAGRSAFQAVEADRHHANLYLVVVGKTSRARKGTSWRRVAALAAWADPPWWDDHVLSGLSSREGLLDQLEELGDDKRLLAFEPEFASVLSVMAREGNAISAGLRQAWDSGHLGTITRHKPLRVKEAHLSLIGHITVEELTRLLTDTDVANGVGNRILWCCAKRSKLLPEGGGDAELGPVLRQLKKALNWSRTARELKRSPAAAELWKALYPKLTSERGGKHGLLTSRAEAQVLRLSLIYALLDRAKMIDAEHLRAALAVWNYCDRSVRYIFDDSTGNRDADVLLREIRAARAKGLGGREIYAVFSNHRTQEEMAVILGVLQEGGYAQGRKVTTGGRESERWYATTGCEQSEQSERSASGNGTC